MKRAYHSFSILQATAAIAGLAIILWSLGLPSFNFVEAANVTTLSDTLSDAAPGVVSNHTITFTTPTGVAATETVTLDFSDGPFVVGSVDETDVDMATTSEYTLGTSCGSVDATAAFSGTTLTITMCAGFSIPANGTTTIKIGTNATFGGDTGDANAQMTNPAAGSYQIPVTAGTSDTGETRVAIVSTVLVSASVDTVFNFSVSGVTNGTSVNTADTTGGDTTATTIPFGELTADTASTAAQQLAVTTNAANGFVVTVISDGQLDSTTGADIDGFRNGNYDSTPVAWEAPAKTLGSENTYGHWGVSSDDTTLTAGLSDLYTGGDNFVSASTTPVEVFRHDSPTDSTVGGQGTTTVIYKVEVGSLQEAAEDYQATLTYVATPVF